MYGESEYNIMFGELLVLLPRSGRHNWSHTVVLSQIHQPAINALTWAAFYCCLTHVYSVLAPFHQVLTSVGLVPRRCTLSSTTRERTSLSRRISGARSVGSENTSLAHS